MLYIYLYTYIDKYTHMYIHNILNFGHFYGLCIPEEHYTFYLLVLEFYI